MYAEELTEGRAGHAVADNDHVAAAPPAEAAEHLLVERDAKAVELEHGRPISEVCDLRQQRGRVEARGHPDPRPGGACGRREQAVHPAGGRRGRETAAVPATA